MYGRALAAALGVCIFCSAAQADLTPVGDPFPSGSWSQAWKYTGDPIDMFAVEVLNGTAFEAPALMGFSDGSWAVSGTMGDSAVSAEGDPVSMLGVFTHFQGSASEGVEVRFATWLEGEFTPFAVQVATYDGGWTVADGEWNVTRDDFGAMPVPASAFLAMIGMPVVGWAKRRFGSR